MPKIKKDPSVGSLITQTSKEEDKEIGSQYGVFVNNNTLNYLAENTVSFFLKSKSGLENSFEPRPRANTI
ncbi:MAG: hypothetical protein LCH30_11440 [Proteobacteria bacterium]|nr:hypothetical protein [Pseudomonadota bacterium]